MFHLKIIHLMKNISVVKIFWISNCLVLQVGDLPTKEAQLHYEVVHVEVLHAETSLYCR